MSGEIPLVERGRAAQLELRWDVGTLEDILGQELDFVPPQTPEEYDERYQIALDTQEAAEFMRGNIRSVAEGLGHNVTPEQFAAWRPGTAEKAKLQKELRQQRKVLRMMDGVDSYLDDPVPEGKPRVPLRRHQRIAVDKFGDFLATMPRTTPEGGKSGIIEMPTGTGKTGIFANIAAAIKHNEDPDDPISVLVVVPTQTILRQTIGAKGDRGFGKFAPHLDVGAYYEDAKEIDHEVVVMCQASFNELMKQGAMPHFDTVIVDEAHKVIGEGIGNAVREYCADKIAVGLTATPEYDENHTAYELFEHTIHQMHLRDAVKAGLLAPVRAWLKRADPYINLRTLPKDSLERKAAIRNAQYEARKQAATELIKNELQRGVGVIVRCPPGDDIDHAYSYAKELRQTLIEDEAGLYRFRYINAGYVGGSRKRQKKQQRYELLELFDEGRMDALAYVKALGMGWDSPHAKVFVNLDPTSSTVEMMQALGRVLRLSRGRNGKPIEAHAYDFADDELGDKQYTPLDVLELKEGELLGAVSEENDKEPLPQRKRRRYRLSPELQGVDVFTVGTAALKNEVAVSFPDAQEVSAGLGALSPDATVERAEVCRILGISPVTLDGIMTNLGSNPNTPLKYADLGVILDLYPGLKAPKLPEGDEYIEVIELAHSAPRFVSALTLSRFAREQRLDPQRFTDEEGKVRFYLKREVGAQLMALAEEREYLLF